MPFAQSHLNVDIVELVSNCSCYFQSNQHRSSSMYVPAPQVDLHTAGATSTTFSLAEQNSDIIAVMPGVMDTGDSLQSQPGTSIHLLRRK